MFGLPSAPRGRSSGQPCSAAPGCLRAASPEPLGHPCGMAEAQPGRGQDAARPPPVQQHRPSAQPPCWYAVLGVAPVAGVEEIRRAYRQAALRLHPDKAGSGSGDVSGSCRGDGVGGGATAGDEFWLVQQAWEVSLPQGA